MTRVTGWCRARNVDGSNDARERGVVQTLDNYAFNHSAVDMAFKDTEICVKEARPRTVLCAWAGRRRTGARFANFFSRRLSFSRFVVLYGDMRRFSTTLTSWW